MNKVPDISHDATTSPRPPAEPSLRPIPSWQEAKSIPSGSVEILGENTAYKTFKYTRFFGSLDGLRALAIIAVIWHHTAGPATSFPLLHRGNNGVALFFAISGFLIVTLILRSKERKGSFSLVNFWGRRALRIFPIYYAVLAVYSLLVWKFERDPVYSSAFFANLPAFATFTSNWFVNLNNPRVIFYFAWSLAAEEQFYLVWPWIEKLSGKLWPAFIAIAALVLTSAVGLIYGRSAETNLPLKMITSIPAAILLGVLLAHALNSAKSFSFLNSLLGRRGSALGALILSVLALYYCGSLGGPGEILIGICLTLFVGACVIREDNDLSVLLGFKPIAWVGTVSYGMYLIHMICVNLIRKALSGFHIASPFLDFAGGCILAIAFASVSYLTYERFFLKMKDRFFRT